MNIANLKSVLGTKSVNNAQKTNKRTMTKDEIINGYVNKATELLAGRSEREVPENGKFTHVFMAFDVPESANEAILEISHDPLDPKTQRNFSVNVHRKISDMFISQTLFTGTKKEMIEYLNNKDIQANIAASVKELSESVDDKM